MPNRTVYINRANDEFLGRELSVSGTINRLLAQHYGLEVSEEPIPPVPKLNPRAGLEKKKETAREALERAEREQLQKRMNR